MDGLVCKTEGPFFRLEDEKWFLRIMMIIGDKAKVVDVVVPGQRNVDPVRDVLPSVHILAAAFSEESK